MTDPTPVMRFEPDGEPVGTALALPGRYPHYSSLLLGFAARALTQHGWVVEQFSWDPPAHETEGAAKAWAGAQLAAVAPDTGRVLVVGKSLATFSAPLAAERGYPAIWLTPVLTAPTLVEAFAANPARQLLVGGSRDDAWDADVAGRLAASGCDVLQVEDADHGMLLPGDIVRGAKMHVEVTRAMVAFAASLAGGGARSRLD